MSGWTEAAVVARLRDHFHIGRDDRIGAMYSMLTQVPWAGRVIDVLVFGPGGMRLAIEVKVSVADYGNETPEKRAASLDLAHGSFYATPAGLLTRPGAAHLIPKPWGLIEVDDGEPAARYVRECVAHDPPLEDGPDALAEVIARRASTAEEAIRDAAEATPYEVALLRHEHRLLTDSVNRAQEARDRYRRRARDAESAMAAAAGTEQVCADCGEPLRVSWQHADEAIEKMCARHRAEANRLAREAATGARYLGGYPGPVTPLALREADATTQEGTT